MDIGSLTGVVEIEDQLTDKLTEIGRHVRDFAEHFDGVMGTAAIAVGVVTSAVIGAAISITELGEKGSTILGVQNAFDKLAESAGTTGEALRKGLNEGVKDTVSEFQLMQSTSRLMSTGFKATEANMLLVAQTAREMGKATGTDAADGLRTLSNALSTGQTRLLKRYGINVDLKKSEEALAASLHVQVSELSAAGRVEAARIAMLDAMKKRIDLLGISELSFKERIEQAKESIGEWTNHLAMAVASSPNVMHALDAIGKSIQENFGGTGQTAMEMIVNWVNKFADAVAEYGPKIVTWVREVVDWVKAVYKAVLDAWDKVPDWFKSIAKESALTTGSIYLADKAVQSLTGTDALGAMSNFAQIWSVIGENVKKAGKNIGEFGVIGAIERLPILTKLAGGFSLELGFIGVGALLAKEDMDKFIDTQNRSMKAMEDAKTIQKAFTDAKVLDWGQTRDLKDIEDTLREGRKLSKTQLEELKGIESAYKDALPMSTAAVNDLAAAQERLNKARTIPLPAGSPPPKPIDFSTPPSYFNDKNDFVPLLKGPLKIESDADRAAREKAKADADSFVADLSAQYKKASEAYSKAGVSKQLEELQHNLAAVGGIGNFTAEGLKKAYDAIIPLRNEGGKLSSLMKEIVEKEERWTMAQAPLEAAMLGMLGVTLQLIESKKKLGMTEDMIAHSFNVSKASLTALTTAYAAHDAANETANQAELDRNAASVAEVNAAQAKGNDMLIAADAKYIDTKSKLSINSAQSQIDQINREADAQIALYPILGTQAEQYTKKVRAEAKLRTDALMGVDDILKNYDQRTLDFTAARAHAALTKALGDKEHFKEAAIKALQDEADAADRAAGKFKSTWANSIDGVAGALKSLAEVSKGALGEVVALASSAADAFAKMTAAAKAYNDGAKKSFGEAAQYYVAQITAVVAIYQQAVAFLNKDILTDATLKSSIKDVDAFRRSAILARQDVTLLFSTTSLSTFNSELKRIQANIDIMQARMEKYNLTWKDMGAMPTVSGNGAIPRGGGVDPRQAYVTSLATGFVTDFNELIRQGFAADAVITGMSGSLNQLIIDAAKTGTKLPASIQPMIEKMIRLGLVTDEAARAILGLAADTMPSLADITAAADRYGMKLDELGPKVRQLSINDRAKQIAADFDMFAKAGVPFANLVKHVRKNITDTGEDFDMMGQQAQDAYIKAGGIVTSVGVSIDQKAQDLVTDALKYGATLPESMKPYLQTLVDSGDLVDANGEKLTDLSKLTFAKDLTQMFDTLIEKLDKLIDKISGGDGVTGALDDVSRKKPVLDVTVNYHTGTDDRGGDRGAGNNGGSGEDNTQHAAGGGRILAFPGRPRGIDTVPTWTAVGERVLTTAETREYERGKETTTNIFEFDGRELARIVVPKLTPEVKRYKVGGRT